MNSQDFALMMTPSMRKQSRSKQRAAKRACSPNDGERRKVLHNYHDHAHVAYPHDADVEKRRDDKRKGPRGGVSVPFPTKLHVMLSKVEEDGLSHIVTWQPHGRCFIVHKPKEFVSEVMPTYFRQSKLTSFQRQLNLYGFSRITTGRDRGGYYHELFLKHRLFLCQNMSRIRIKGTGIKGKTSPETEPDFYNMPWVKPEMSAMDLDRDLEGEATAAMEDENNRFQTNAKSQDGLTKKKHHARKNTKKKDIGADRFGSSTKGALVVNTPSALVTPDTRGAKEQLPMSCFDHAVSSSPTEHNVLYSQHYAKSNSLGDLCPPLLLSDSGDATNDEDPQSGEDITFEGKHFHYLDSFVAQTSPSLFALKPRKSIITDRPALPAHLPSLHDSSMSVAQSLCEPLLTPSSSSSSLSAILKQEENLEINPNTIFSENMFDGDLDEYWEV